MNAPDAQLKRMIARLTSMSDADRAYVLERLGPDAREILAPSLTASGLADALSPDLQAVLLAVERGQPPQAMTAKAIAAVRLVCQQATLPNPGLVQTLDDTGGRVSGSVRKGAR